MCAGRARSAARRFRCTSTWRTQTRSSSAPCRPGPRRCKRWKTAFTATARASSRIRSDIAGTSPRTWRTCRRRRCPSAPRRRWPLAESRALTPPPDRRALLLERVRPLLGVLGGEHGPGDGGLLLPHLRAAPVELLLQDALGRGQRQGAVLGEPGGELERDVHCGARLRQAVDEAEFVE